MTLAEAFEEWWSALPSEMKRKKQRARARWDRTWRENRKRWRRHEDMLLEMRGALLHQLQAQHFRGRDGQDYYPHAATWLADGRVDDEVKRRPREAATAQQGPSPARRRPNRLIRRD